MANGYVTDAMRTGTLELETVAGWDEKLGRVTWDMCAPGGDTLLTFLEHLAPEEQEWLANKLAAAFPVREVLP